jgi:HD-like signal output (HDOD) protein
MPLGVLPIPKNVCAMSENAKKLVDGSLDLVTLPDVYLRVKEVLEDPESSAADMAGAIQTDPATTARLLRMANSPFFGFAAQVEQVSRAVSLLGTMQIHDLVLATSVAASFAGIKTDVLNVATFWHDSVRRAVGAKLIAARCNLLDGERVFVAGLLSHIGEMVLALKIPEMAKRAATSAANRHLPLHVVQREMLGMDYAAVGGELLRVWHLPESLEETVRHHIEPANATAYPLETAIIHVADHIVRDTDDDEFDPMDLAILEEMPLDSSVLDEVTAELKPQVADVMALLFPMQKSA